MYVPPKKKGPRATKVEFTGKIRLRVGDTVRVIAGKDKNKEGKVTRVLPAQGKVVVEGINIIIRHQKPRPQGQQTVASQQQQSGRVPLSAPVHVSKVQLIDPADNQHVTRIGVRVDSSGQRVRFARKSGGLL